MTLSRRVDRAVGVPVEDKVKGGVHVQVQVHVKVNVNVNVNS
jgi:hypothetical protein